jgi:hypothetical protein
MSTMRFTQVELPPLSVLGPEPVLGTGIYLDRWRRARERMEARGIDALLVYADREHPASISWLTGFDPRFEEALLVLPANGTPTIIAGNESLSMVADRGLGLNGVLCQSFSLAGQDRSKQRRLSNALLLAGVTQNSTVGLVGWRAISSEDAPHPHAFAVPQFVVSEITAVTEHLVDGTVLLAATEGLRALNEVDQLALYEHRSTRTSHHIWRAIEAIRPGMSELELSSTMGLTGLPLSCHVMCATGSKTVNGLYSPSDRVIQRGDRISTAVGLWGGLTSRAGRVAEHGDEWANEEFQYFASGYWHAVTTWYSRMKTGADVRQVAEATIADLASFGITPLLNPGHLQQVDEWLDSPFTRDSAAIVRSGWSLQADIIPVGSNAELFVNMEDALAIADESLRAEFAERYPEAWGRITGRRDFMRNVLGIQVSDDVLPFCDRQGVLTHAFLTPNIVPTLA